MLVLLDFKEYSALQDLPAVSNRIGLVDLRFHFK